MKHNQRTLVFNPPRVWIAITALVSPVRSARSRCPVRGSARRHTLSPAGNPACRIAGCPDDYCGKPSPCICAPNCFLADTYCRKPCLLLPCPTKPCCPDDYQSKPTPCHCGPPGNRWYKCVPYPCCDWLRTRTCDAPELKCRGGQSLLLARRRGRSDNACRGVLMRGQRRVRPAGRPRKPLRSPKILWPCGPAGELHKCRLH
jgi:hypothetical protein